MSLLFMTLQDYFYGSISDSKKYRKYRKTKQTSSTCNKSGKHLRAEPVFMGFGEINMPSKSGRKIPHVRTKLKPKGASIESHPKLITDTYTKNDDCRKKGGDKKKVTSLFNLKADT